MFIETLRIVLLLIRGYKCCRLYASVYWPTFISRCRCPQLPPSNIRKLPQYEVETQGTPSLLLPRILTTGRLPQSGLAPMTIIICRVTVPPSAAPLHGQPGHFVPVFASFHKPECSSLVFCLQQSNVFRNKHLISACDLSLNASFLLEVA